MNYFECIDEVNGKCKLCNMKQCKGIKNCYIFKSGDRPCKKCLYIKNKETCNKCEFNN